MTTSRRMDIADAAIAVLADAAATGLAELVIWWCSPERRPRVRARFELFLEADRNDEIREKLREPRESFIAYSQAALAAVGMPATRTLAITINAMVEGLLLNEIAGVTPIDETKLRALLGALSPPSP